MTGMGDGGGGGGGRTHYDAYSVGPLEIATVRDLPLWDRLTA